MPGESRERNKNRKTQTKTGEEKRQRFKIRSVGVDRYEAY